LEFIINGGFKTWEMVEESMVVDKGLTGVMLGRAAYDNPAIFSEVDKRFYKKDGDKKTRRDI